jgi:osmotically inducible lipoprotein OsmB
MEFKMTVRVATGSARFGLAAVALSALLLSGCAGMGDTEQRVLTGAAIGAGAGAGLGAVTGGLSIPAGAIIGAGAGAVTGLGVDLLKKQQP